MFKMATEPKVSKGRALEILGLSAGASKDDIKRAYKNRAREWHPDKNSEPNATEKFQELSTAYRALVTHDSQGGPDDTFDDGEWSSGSDDEDCVYYFDDRELFFILLQDLLFRRRFSYTRGPYGFAAQSQDNSRSNNFRPRQRETFYDHSDVEDERWEKQPKPSSRTSYQQEEHARNDQFSSQTGFSSASTSYSRKYDQGNDDEDAELYDFLKRDRKAEEGDDDDLDPDEVVKKYKSYEEWKKAKKQKKKMKLPPKPRPLSKRQQQNQQYRRDKEMQEIQVELLKMNLEKEEKEKTRREKEEIKKMEEEVAEVERRKQAVAETIIPEHREKKDEKKKRTSKRRDNAPVVQEDSQKLILERQRELERQRNLNEQQQIQAAEAERRRNTIVQRTNQAHQHQYVNSAAKQQNFNSSHQPQVAISKRSQPAASKSHDSAPYCRSRNNMPVRDTPRPPACNAWLQGPPAIPTPDGTVQAKVAPVVPAPNTPEEEEEMLRRAIELSMKEQIEQQELLLNLIHSNEPGSSNPDANPDSWGVKASDDNGWEQTQQNSVEFVRSGQGVPQKEEKACKSSTTYWTSNDSRAQHKPRKVQTWPPPQEENWDEEVDDIEAPKNGPDISVKPATCDWTVTGARPKSSYHGRERVGATKWNCRANSAKPYIRTPEAVQPAEEWNSTVANDLEAPVNEDETKVVGEPVDELETNDVIPPVVVHSQATYKNSGNHLTFDQDEGLCKPESQKNLNSGELNVDNGQPKSNFVCNNETTLFPAQSPVIVNSMPQVSTSIDSEQVTSEQLSSPSHLGNSVGSEIQNVLHEQSPDSEVSHQMNPEHSPYFCSEQSQVPRLFQQVGIQRPLDLNKSSKVGTEQPPLINGLHQFINEQQPPTSNAQGNRVELDRDSPKVHASTATGFNDGQLPVHQMPPFPENKMARMFYEQGAGMGLPFMGSIPNLGMVPVPGMFNPYMPSASNPLLQSVAYMNMMYGGLHPPIGGLPQLSPFPGIGPVPPMHVNPYVNYAFPYPPVNNLVQNSNMPNMQQFQEKCAGFSSKDNPDSAQVPSEVIVDEVVTESSQSVSTNAMCGVMGDALKDTYQSDDESDSEVFCSASEMQREDSLPVDTDSKRDVDKFATAVNSKDWHTAVPASERNTSQSSSYSQTPPLIDDCQLPSVSQTSIPSHKESQSADSKVNLYTKPFPSANARGNHNPVRLRGCLRARGARRGEPFSHQRTTYSSVQSAAQGVCNNPRPQFKSPFYEAEDTRARRTKTAVVGSSMKPEQQIFKKGGHS